MEKAVITVRSHLHHGVFAAYCMYFFIRSIDDTVIYPSAARACCARRQACLCERQSALWQTSLQYVLTVHPAHDLNRGRPPKQLPAASLNCILLQAVQVRTDMFI